MEENREDVALFSRQHTNYTETSEPQVQNEELENTQRPIQYAECQDEYRSGSAGTNREYQEPTPGSQEAGGHIQGQLEMTTFDDVLGDVHEKALSAAGFGRLQWLLFVILGLALMGDGIELLIMVYILPSAEKDLCMNEQMKGWLGMYN